MTRKKRKTAESTIVDPTQTDIPAAQPSASATPATVDDAIDQAGDENKRAHLARSFKATLTVADKGVTLGARDGHDWVVSFPGDPGVEMKDKLKGVGFAYSDRKWKVFTNAGNRQPVETLMKDLKRQLGEEIHVREYNCKQIVLAFDGFPGEEIIDQLKDSGFFYRSDRTWNADSTPANRKLAHELIKSLPPVSRSADAPRSIAR